MKVNDEYTFITDISYQLSQRYQRPQSAILISLGHSSCMLFAGSFEPAYTLNVTALPSLVQPMTNRRNAALLARVLEDALGVPPSRGVIRFTAAPEDNYATDGNTYAGALADLERVSGDGANIKRSASRQSRTKKRSSMRSMRNLRLGFSSGEKKSDHEDDMTPPASLRGAASPVPLPAMPGKSDMDRRAEKAQTLGKRKSLMSIFSRREKDKA